VTRDHLMYVCVKLPVRYRCISKAHSCDTGKRMNCQVSSGCCVQLTDTREEHSGKHRGATCVVEVRGRPFPDVVHVLLHLCPLQHETAAVQMGALAERLERTLHKQRHHVLVCTVNLCTFDVITNMFLLYIWYCINSYCQFHNWGL